MLRSRQNGLGRIQWNFFETMQNKD